MEIEKLLPAFTSEIELNEDCKALSISLNDEKDRVRIVAQFPNTSVFGLSSIEKILHIDFENKTITGYSALNSFRAYLDARRKELNY